MFNLSLAFVTSIVSIAACGVIVLGRSEVSEERRAKKEAAARRKLLKIGHAYAKERLQERERLDRDLSALTRLLKEKSIDKQTHERYKKLLQMSYEQKRQQTRTRFGFTNRLAAD